MEAVLHTIIEYGNLVISAIALLIITYGTVMSVTALFKKMEKTPGIYIGESLDLALRYLMVSEVLHTFTADTLTSILNLGLLLVIRIAIVMFNQKEMEHELKVVLEEEELIKEIEEI